MNTSRLDTIWLKAAVAGGLWASVEIIVGSFLHNLRVPFAGAVLASFGVLFMVAFFRMWPLRGLIWRAGLVCALMKSISPSATLLGPMIGIFAESLVLEFMIRLMGPNFLSMIIAGGTAVMTAFAQKLFSILIIYGFNLVKIYINLLEYVSRQLGLEEVNPWALVLILFVVYFGLGAFAGLLGILTGKKVQQNDSVPYAFHSLEKNKNFAQSNELNHYSIIFLVFNIIAIPAGILLLNHAELYVSASIIILYLIFTLIMYGQLRRRITKPIIWIQLIILTILSGIFYEYAPERKVLFTLSGIKVGLEMCLRALLIISAFSGISFELSNPIVRRFLFSNELSQLYYAVSLAFKAMPAMLENAPRPKLFLRKPIHSLARMLATANTWNLILETGNEELKDYPPGSI